VYLVYRLRTLVTLIVISALLAYVLEPAVDRLQRIAFRGLGRPLPRWAAVLTLFLWLGTALAAAGWFLLPPLAEQISGLVERLPRYYGEAQAVLTRFVQQTERRLPEAWQQQIGTYMGQFGSLAIGFARNSVSFALALFGSLLGLLLVPILTYFMLISGPGLRPKVLSWFAPRLRPEVDFLMGEVNTVMFKFLRGRLIVSVLVGLLCGAGAWVIGVPYPLLLGIFAGAMDLIPFVGPFIAAVPAVAFALLEEPARALWVAGWYVLVQQIEQVVLSPRIEGGELELNAAVVIVAATAGGQLFGFIGVLLAVPITALVRIALLYVRAKLRGEPLRPIGQGEAEPEGEEPVRA
jgi:predicted PurR-regulated permease PerM